MKLKLRGERVVREDFEVTPHEAHKALLEALVAKLTPEDLRVLPKDDIYIDAAGYWYTSEGTRGGWYNEQCRKATPDEKASWDALTQWKHLSFALVACLENK